MQFYFFLVLYSELSVGLFEVTNQATGHSKSFTSKAQLSQEIQHSGRNPGFQVGGMK